MVRACSETGFVPSPGLFTTAISLRVQAAMSIESVPRPEEATMQRRRVSRSASSSMRTG
jgi:hypothetical protein